MKKEVQERASFLSECSNIIFPLVAEKGCV